MSRTPSIPQACESRGYGQNVENLIALITMLCVPGNNGRGLFNQEEMGGSLALLFSGSHKSLTETIDGVIIIITLIFVGVVKMVIAQDCATSSRRPSQ